MICPTCKGTGDVPDICGHSMGEGRWCPRESGHSGYHACNDDPSKWWLDMEAWNSKLKSAVM